MEKDTFLLKYQFSIVYVDSNIGNPTLPVMPRQYQKYIEPKTN
jgi:hypothetical protein